jgi:hypothetical protein
MNNISRFSRAFIALPFIAALALAGCDKAPQQQQQTTATAYQQGASDTGTGGTGFDSQPSDAPLINVDAVKQALSQVQANNSQDWLQAFEKRVNEIYEGQGVVSIDAKTDAANNLQIVGYVAQSGQQDAPQGFQQGVDQELFSIQQTSAVANNDAPYQMQYYTYGGSVGYYSGYYHNPFLTGWMVNTLIYGHPWGGYYTSPARLVVIHDYRTTYRTTPAFVSQRTATHSYYNSSFHGAPVTVRPGMRVGTGAPMSVRPNVSAPHIGTPPAAVAPARNTGPSMFNRPNSAAPAYKPYTPSRPSGGLFNRGTFGGGSRSFSSGRRR